MIASFKFQWTLAYIRERNSRAIGGMRSLVEDGRRPLLNKNDPKWCGDDLIRGTPIWATKLEPQEREKMRMGMFSAVRLVDKYVCGSQIFLTRRYYLALIADGIRLKILETRYSTNILRSPRQYRMYSLVQLYQRVLPASGRSWLRADSLPRRTCNSTGNPAAICSLLTSIVSASLPPY